MIYSQGLQPHHETQSPNQKISLYKGRIQLVHENMIFEGEGEVYIKWFPSARILFSMDCDNLPPTIGFFGLRAGQKVKINLNSDYQDVDAFLQKVTTEWQVVGMFNNSNSNRSFNFQKLDFHLVNFVDFSGDTIQRGRFWTKGRLKLEFKNWSIIIDSLENPESGNKIFKALKDDGGYVITHVCRLFHKDDILFDFNDIDDIIQGLNCFLSFVAGRWVGVGLFYGLDEKNEVIWESWQYYNLQPFQQCSSWFPTQKPKEVEYLFSRFMDIWKDNYQESISILIYWYVESNQVLSPQSLLMAQSALELLSWIFVTHGIITNNQFSEDLKAFNNVAASEKLRILMSWCSLPLDLPDNYQSSGLLLNEIHEILEKDKTQGDKLKDIPGCLANIRNRLAHPPRQKTKQQITVYNTQAKIEATRLSLWYLELCLLHWFGYQGEYSNRLLKTKNSGDYEKVPWVKNQISSLLPAK